MIATCQGCHVTVTVDRYTGRLQAADGSSGEMTFADNVLVIWECPSCSYPHANPVDPMS